MWACPENEIANSIFLQSLDKVCKQMRGFLELEYKSEQTTKHYVYIFLTLSSVEL